MTILDKIIAAKQDEVAYLKRTRPISELKTAILNLPSPRDFFTAISGRDCAIIAEVKRRSPSKGILREEFDPVKIASIYEKNGAAAISVLTDREFFGGDKCFLANIKQSVRIPLLRKDFVIDPYQIYETRYLQGDAVLLIAAILSKVALRTFIQLTESLGLFALVEIHTQEELDTSLDAGASLIGINNRNLTTFATDLKTTLDIAPKIPGGKIIVSESGIHTRDDIKILLNAGIHAFLIGETLMRSEDMGIHLRKLLGNE